MMKKKWKVTAISCIMASLMLLTGCSTEKKEEYFNASVLETSDSGFLVKPMEGEDLLKSADRILVSKTVVSTEKVPEFKAGDEIRVVYDGKVLDTDPPSVSIVYSLYDLKELYARDLYAARNPFIGDASADGKLFGLLADQFKVTEKRTTELMTSERPYVFILHFTSAPDEKKMTKIAAALLALIENCDEVRWDYPEGGDTILKQVNIAKAEELLHVSDLKELGTSEENVVKLLHQLEGIDSF